MENRARLLWLAILVAPAGAVGQRLTPLPQNVLNTVRWPSASRQFTQVRPAPGTPPRTYWLEGGLVGGIGLGVVSAVELRSACESRSCTAGTIAGGVLGGFVGFTVGALVGGAFRKGEKAPS
jgi:hypothetical protein